jgi:hypothetical protein
MQTFSELDSVFAVVSGLYLRFVLSVRILGLYPGCVSSIRIFGTSVRILDLYLSAISFELRNLRLSLPREA